MTEKERGVVLSFVIARSKATKQSSRYGRKCCKEGAHWIASLSLAMTGERQGRLDSYVPPPQRAVSPVPLPVCLQWNQKGVEFNAAHQNNAKKGPKSPFLMRF
jgi:hypothetical protein